MTSARVAVFGPHPILTVTIETRGAGASDDIHVHAGGQGVWVARMAAQLGARTRLCGTIGGETGTALGPLLADLPIEVRLIRTAAASGSYVMDRRTGGRRPIATAWAPAPDRHEADDLFSLTLATALESDVLVVTNPLPGDALPMTFFTDLVADVRGAGVAVLADLSPPRLDAALAGGPDLVRINDWELAQYVTGPVDTIPQRVGAVRRLREQGAASVIVTRGGAPAYGCDPHGGMWEFVPPLFEQGSAEGCGDAMMGAMAVGWAQGTDWTGCVRVGMAAGAANFLRHGLGSAEADVVDRLLPHVAARPLVTS